MLLFSPHIPSRYLWILSLNPLFWIVHVSGRGRGRGRGGPNFQRSATPQHTPGGRKIRSELKTSQQILKQRKKNQKQQFLQGGGMKKLRAKNKQFVGDVKKSGFGRGGQKKGKMRKRLWGGCRGRWRCEMAGAMRDRIVATLSFPTTLNHFAVIHDYGLKELRKLSLTCRDELQLLLHCLLNSKLETDYV